MEWLQRLLTVRLLPMGDGDDEAHDETAQTTITTTTTAATTTAAAVTHVLPHETLSWRVEVLFDNEDGRHDSDALAFLAAVGARDLATVWCCLFARLRVLPRLSRLSGDDDEGANNNNNNNNNNDKDKDKDSDDDGGAAAALYAGTAVEVACLSTRVTPAFVAAGDHHNSSGSNETMKAMTTAATHQRIPAGIVSTYDVNWTVPHELAIATTTAAAVVTRELRVTLRLLLSLLPPLRVASLPSSLQPSVNNNNNSDSDNDDDDAACARRVLWRVLRQRRRVSSVSATMQHTQATTAASIVRVGSSSCSTGNNDDDGECDDVDDAVACAVPLCCCRVPLCVQRVLACAATATALDGNRVLVSCTVTNVSPCAAAAAAAAAAATATASSSSQSTASPLPPSATCNNNSGSDVRSCRRGGRGSVVVVVLQRVELDMHTTRLCDGGSGSGSLAGNTSTRAAPSVASAAAAAAAMSGDARTTTTTRSHDYCANNTTSSRVMHAMSHRRGVQQRAMRAVDVLVERLLTVSPLLPTAQVERPPVVLRADESYTVQFVLHVVPQLCYLHNPHSLEHVYATAAGGSTATTTATMTTTPPPPVTPIDSPVVITSAPPPAAVMTTTTPPSGATTTSSSDAVVHDRLGVVVPPAELLAILSSAYITQLFVHYAVVCDAEEGEGGDGGDGDTAVRVVRGLQLQHAVRWSFAA